MCFYPTTPDLPQLIEDAMRAQEEEDTIAFELAQRCAAELLCCACAASFWAAAVCLCLCCSAAPTQFTVQ